MKSLTLLNQSVVSESEIDSLGHMNVRFYVARAANAHSALLKKLGVNAGEGQSLRRTDTYNRFHKEQFEGAKLSVLGGLVALPGNSGISGYYEIRNSDTDEVAAAFIITVCLIDLKTDAIIPLPALNEAELAKYEVEIPAHGKPRSLSLAPLQQVTMAELAPLIANQAEPGSITGRMEAVVLADDCDAAGQLRADIDLMFVMFRPQPGVLLKEIGPTLQRDEHGRRYSFAMMEIRSINWHRPKSHDSIVSYSADVAYGEKWRQTRRWMFDKHSGLLLGVSDNAAVCMDLDARRAIPIPIGLRETIERDCLANYA